MCTRIPRRRNIELFLASPDLQTVCFWIFLDTPTDFRGVFRILGALRAPRMLDYPVKSVGSVQKYPKTVNILDTTSKIGRENPNIALFCVF